MILGDVPKEILQAGEPSLAQRLVEYVRDHGGGLVALAGARFPADSGIAEALPVIFAGTKRLLQFPQSRAPTLTEDGRKSRALLLSDDPRESLEIWEKRLPGIYSCLGGVRAKPAARILAVISGRQGERSEIPLYVMLRLGKGKTFFVGTDESWRWRAGVDNLYFGRFWKQVIETVARRRP